MTEYRLLTSAEMQQREIDWLEWVVRTSSNPLQISLAERMAFEWAWHTAYIRREDELADTRELEPEDG